VPKKHRNKQRNKKRRKKEEKTKKSAHTHGGRRGNMASAPHCIDVTRGGGESGDRGGQRYGNGGCGRRGGKSAFSVEKKEKKKKNHLLGGFSRCR
jgi:hypothetical protein